MKKVILAVIVLGVASACTVRSERTIVERPVTPAPATAVVVTDPPPSTVYVPAR